jgi:hypothetical protein
MSNTPHDPPASTAKSWRDTIKVHPAANLFPMMSDAEIDALAADIKKYGLSSPIVYYLDQEHNELLLIDGRNRIEAAQRAGYSITVEDISEYSPIDPYAFVISANIHRRHLTAEQKRELIAKLLKASPEKSDRQIAKTVGVNHETVAAVRKKKVAAGDVAESATRTDTRGRQQPAKKPEPERPEEDPDVERDRKTCIALNQKVLEAKRERARRAGEQVKEAEDQLSLVYDLERAVAHIASIDMTPAQFLKYAQHHQPNQIETAEDLARLERATEWLTELVAIGRKRLLGPACQRLKRRPQVRHRQSQINKSTTC